MSDLSIWLLGVMCGVAIGGGLSIWMLETGRASMYQLDRWKRLAEWRAQKPG